MGVALGQLRSDCWGRDEEVSNEFTVPETEEKHGALTYFLMQELANARSGMTYRDVFERAAANVTAHKPLQHPQMEGSIDRHVFGVSMLVPTDSRPYFPARAIG